MRKNSAPRTEETHKARRGVAERQPRSETDVKRLLHELEVHQVELEMQNAELRTTRDELGNMLAQYTELYDFAPVGYFTLDEKAIVRSANLTGASLLGVERAHLIGRSFLLSLDPHDGPLFTSFLSRVLAGDGKLGTEAVLNH